MRIPFSKPRPWIFDSLNICCPPTGKFATIQFRPTEPGSPGGAAKMYSGTLSGQSGNGGDTAATTANH